MDMEPHEKELFLARFAGVKTMTVSRLIKELQKVSPRAKVYVQVTGVKIVVKAGAICAVENDGSVCVLHADDDTT